MRNKAYVARLAEREQHVFSVSHDSVPDDICALVKDMQSVDAMQKGEDPLTGYTAGEIRSHYHFQCDVTYRPVQL